MPARDIMSRAEARKNPPVTPVRIAAFGLSLMLAILVASCGGKDDSRADQPDLGDPQSSQANLFTDLPAPDEIILEAEDAALEPPMVIKHDEVPPNMPEMFYSSGGKYVNLPDTPRKDGESEDRELARQEKKGKIIFDFEVEETARYRLWARINWLDGCGNSFGVVMDNGPMITLGDDGTYKRWRWVSIKGKEGQFRLTKGKHRLEFRHTEDGASLDQILLTTNLDEQAQPQGILAP